MHGFSIVVIGSNGVGKSTMIERHKTGKFLEEPLEENDYPQDLTFHTNYGMFNVIARQAVDDVPECQAVIFMFDVTDADSWAATQDQVEAFDEDVPKVVVGNKVDVRDREVLAADIAPWRQQQQVQYYDHSAKSNYNFDKPFFYLLRQLTGHNDLTWAEPAPVLPVINL